MGDLPVLVGMRDLDADEPMCRIFILLLARTSLLVCWVEVSSVKVLLPGLAL